jgi:hypothetical protein
MKKTLLAAALFGAVSIHAYAQTTTTEGDTPAVVTPDAPASGVLVEGENSYTEAQAKERIAEAGYANVSALRLDEKGIWRGTASKSGRSMSVGVDYQGNVVAQ